MNSWMICYEEVMGTPCTLGQICPIPNMSNETHRYHLLSTIPVKSLLNKERDNIRPQTSKL